MTVLLVIFHLATMKMFYDYLWHVLTPSQMIIWCGYHDDTPTVDENVQKCLTTLSLLKEDVYVLCVKNVPENTLQYVINNAYRQDRLWVFQSEQMTFNYSVGIYREICTRFPRIRLLHYSDANIRLLLQQKVSFADRQFYLPLLPCSLNMYERYWREPKIHDVAFIGTLYKERMEIILKLRTKFNVTLLSSFGDERDREVAQSRILVNIHSKNNRILESVRCVPAVLSGTVVVTQQFERQSLSSVEEMFVVAKDDDLIVAIQQTLKNYETIRREQMHALYQYNAKDYVHCKPNFELDSLKHFK